MNTCCWPCDRFAISSELKGYCLRGILPPAYLQSSSYIYEARYKDKEDKDPSLRRISDDWVKTEKVPLDLKRKGKGLLTELRIKLLFCCFFQIWKWKKILKSLGLHWETSISCSGQVGDQLNILYLSTFALKLKTSFLRSDWAWNKDV